MSQAEERQSIANKNNKYFGVSRNGQFVQLQQLEDWNLLGDKIIWVFHQELESYFRTSFGTLYVALRYTCVDASGNRTTFNYKDIIGFEFFEKHVAAKQAAGYNTFLVCKIFDTNNELLTLELKSDGIKGFVKTVFEQMELLSEARTIKTYNLMIENQKLKEEISRLEKVIEDLSGDDED
jgi:hypothetical protein